MQQKEAKHDTLALDVGKSRVGIALGNSSTKSVETLTSSPRAQKQAEQMVLKLIAEYTITTVVVGLPLDESGKETSEAVGIKQFASRLAKRTEVTIKFTDEWGSSLDAKQRLKIEGDPTKEMRKSGVIDAESASIILERYFQQS